MDRKWVAEAYRTNNPQMLFDAFDFSNYLSLTSEYQSFSPTKKQEEKSPEVYFSRITGIDMNSNRRSYAQYMQELNRQLANPQEKSWLHIDPFSQRDSILDLLRSFENIEYIKKIYKEKKLGVSRDGLNTTNAEFILDWVYPELCVNAKPV